MPRGSIFPPLKSERTRLPAFFYFLVGASDPKVPWVPEGFFSLLFAAKIEQRSSDRDDHIKAARAYFVPHIKYPM